MKTRTLRLTQAKQNKHATTTKIMLVATILCCASPFLYLLYMQMGASLGGVSIMDVIEIDPLVNLNMIVAFVNPFVGYVLFLMRKKVLEITDFQSVYLNLGILLLAQILTMNVLYLCLCAYVLYRVMDVYGHSYKDALHGIRTNYIFRELGGSVLVLMMFLFVCILTLRLNFIVSI